MSRSAKVWFKDRLVEFPFQRHIDQLATEDFIECLRGLGSRDAIEPRDFREMLYSRFGDGICKMFMVPYNEKVFATDLAGLDIEAMGRFFPLADANALLAGLGGASAPTYNSTFTYPEGGAVEFVRALQHGIPPERIRLNEPVVKLDLRRHLAVTPRCTIEYDSLVSTVPLPTLLGLAGLPHDRNLYRHNKVLVFNLGFDGKGPSDVHWIYVPSREVCFYRVGFYDNIWPADRMSLYVEVGCSADADLSCEAIAAMRERVLADLVNTGVVNGQHLVESHHVVLDPAYVHVTQATAEDVIEQKEVLAARGVYTIGRYGSWTYCSIEDNIVEARRLAALFNRSS